MPVEDGLARLSQHEHGFRLVIDHDGSALEQALLGEGAHVSRSALTATLEFVLGDDAEGTVAGYKNLAATSRCSSAFIDANRFIKPTSRP
jgi:hypothetical protein